MALSFNDRMTLYGLRSAIDNGARKIPESVDRQTDAIWAFNNNRDRVDISKQEYDELVSNLKRLREDNTRLRGLLAKIGIPIDFPIIEESIVSYFDYDVDHDVNKCMIRFDYKRKGD